MASLPISSLLFSEILKEKEALATDSAKLKKLALIKERKLIEEFLERQKTPDPKLNVDTQFVLVLSARYTVLNHKAGKGMFQEINHKTENSKMIFQEKDDDFCRILKGMEAVINITKLKLKKEHVTLDEIIKYGPLLIYNGLPAHNRDLQLFFLIKPLLLKRKKEKMPLTEMEKIILNFPVESLRILPLPKNALHTKGQCDSYRKYINNPKANTLVITHFYHSERVDRMPWCDYFNLLTVDKPLKGLDSKLNVSGELDRVVEYSDKGDISVNPQSFPRDAKETIETILACNPNTLTANFKKFNTIGAERNIPSLMTPKFSSEQSKYETMIQFSGGLDDSCPNFKNKERAAKLIRTMV